ncbi:MAG: DUF1801 domain-containing protein [Saonia sp.]
MKGDLPKIKEMLSAIADDTKREDSFSLLQLMTRITKEEPKIWRGTMIGFGTYAYTYDSGREGEWFLTGFCPRKNTLVVYIVAGFNKYDDIMKELGTYKTGSSCLYLNRLADIDLEKLSTLIEKSVHYMRQKHGLS